MDWLLGDKWQNDRRHSIEQANKCPKGIDHSQLVPGALVTMSPCKNTGDRSFTNGIWRVLAANGGHVALECAHRDYGSKPGDRIVCIISEHEWYPAENMLEQMARPQPPENDLHPHGA
jgi:hypothetical protein